MEYKIKRREPTIYTDLKPSQLFVFASNTKELCLKCTSNMHVVLSTGIIYSQLHGDNPIVYLAKQTAPMEVSINEY